MFDFLMGILVRMRICEVSVITYYSGIAIVEKKCYSKREKIKKSKSRAM